MMTRRSFHSTLLTASLSAMAQASPPRQVDSAEQDAEWDENRVDRVRGLLLGSLLGDALGGPFEFADRSDVEDLLPNCRQWPLSRRLDDAQIDALADQLRLEPYEQLRPDIAPYGPWRRTAPAGTLTDDSRHKIVLMRALRGVASEARRHIRADDLAKQFLKFPRLDHDLKYASNGSEQQAMRSGLREYHFAARWQLGQRDTQLALPISRLWSGVDNCSGQMTLLPLAALHIGQPVEAYRATYQVDFIDTGNARDIVSALVAGISMLLQPSGGRVAPSTAFDRLVSTMRSTDPYRFAEVPFVGRRLDHWLDLVDSIVERSDGRPAKLFQLLETEGKPKYFWDAHFTLLVPLVMLKACRHNPLAALRLTLDFGHDTDSYAQVLGGLAGAIHGSTIFGKEMRDTIERRLQEDHEESLEDWVELLVADTQ
ncbi:MAG: ADP-ribosylglycohydrolase family protein [Planctomycetota bacterium]